MRALLSRISSGSRCVLQGGTALSAMRVDHGGDAGGARGRLQISLDTTDVFIDVTATDLTKAKMVLNILCTMFSEYAAQPFTTEPVEVVDALGNSTCAPLSPPGGSPVPLLPCLWPPFNFFHP